MSRGFKDLHAYSQLLYGCVVFFFLLIKTKGLCKTVARLVQGSSNEPPSGLAITTDHESALVSKYKHTRCSLISLFSVKNDVINWKNGDERCRLQSCPRETGCVLRGDFIICLI